MGWAPRFRLRWEGQRTRGVGLPVWWVAHPKFGMRTDPAPAKPALSAKKGFCPAHVRAKTDLIIPPAAAGGSLRRLPSRARGVGRSVFGSPTGARPGGLLRWAERCGETAACALPGESMGQVFSGALWGESGWVIPSDGAPRGDCGVCPPGRVRWTERLSESLRRFLGPLWEWFSCGGPMFFVLGKFFLEVARTFGRSSSVIQGERAIPPWTWRPNMTNCTGTATSNVRTSRPPKTWCRRPSFAGWSTTPGRRSGRPSPPSTPLPGTCTWTWPGGRTHLPSRE